MKKLLIVGFLFFVTLTANAQQTVFNGLLPVYSSGSSYSDSNSFPAAKWAIIMDPLATLGSGIALGADFFVGRLQFRALGAYHTQSKPWFYDGQSFGYTSFEVKNFSGYRFEFQIRKDLTEDRSDNSRFGAGAFLNFKGVTIEGENAYVFNPNPGGSSVGKNASVSGNVITFGPMFTFSEHRKQWYLDMHLGPGMIANAGGKNNDVVGIDIVNPYRPGVMIKFGLVIGLNMK
jgi:hypothetical protein